LQKRPNLFGASTSVKESAGGWIRKKTGRMLKMRMRMRMRRRRRGARARRRRQGQFFEICKHFEP
jgi:hypothetical protein